MKILRKSVSLLFVVLLLGWYANPTVHTLLNGPSVVEMVQAAPGFWNDADRLTSVRTAGDTRLADVTQTDIPVRLFGGVPLRTLHTAGERRSVTVSGHAIGIVLHTKGVQVVGLTPVSAASGIVSPAVEAGLLPGDAILAIDGQPVSNANDFAERCKTADPLSLAVQREGHTRTVTLTPAMDAEGVYRVGAWVRDSTSGIGTLSFIDTVSGRYAALGHGVSDVDTGALFTVGSGAVFSASVTGVLRGSGGDAGELIGVFPTDPVSAIGTVTQNTPCGIAGTLHTQEQGETVPLAAAGEIALGEATMYAQVDGDDIRPYAVRVIRLDVQSSPQVNGFMIEVTDDALLALTGGIVQGMSGSPVVQGGKLIGVVTHVLLQNNRRGYCIYADLMADKLL